MLCMRGDSAHLGERATLKLMLHFSDGKHNPVIITVCFVPVFFLFEEGCSDQRCDSSCTS